MINSHVEAIYGHLPDHWKLVSINDLIRSDVADLQTGPFGTMLHASAYRTEGTPVVAVKNIGNNRLIYDGIPRVDRATTQRLSRYELRIGDILFGRKGSVERRALVRKSEVGWLQGSDCIRLRFTGRTVDSTFVSYVIGTPACANWIMQHAQGATMPSLNQEIIGRMPIPLPPLTEQRAVVNVLGALDDKIELNRRMNKTLEAMARALFKSWFADFDPVRAKAEGRQPAGMDAETAALFPESFEKTEIGEVPRGWRISTIGDEVGVVGGSTPSTAEPAFWDGGNIHWATPKDLADLQAPLLLDTARTITERGLRQISSGLLPAGTVLLSSRAPVGYLAIAEVPLAINQGFIAMRCEHQLPNSYLLNWAQSNMEVIEGRANGTTFMEVSKSNFRTIPVIVPPVEILGVFQAIVGGWYSKIAGNLRESQTLAELRDTLLPRLMSGEVRVDVV